MTEFQEYGPFLDALFLEAHHTLSARDLNHRMAARVRIPCLPIVGFPEFTASGNRFRVPGFCSAIKPRFLLVQRTSDSADDLSFPETNNSYGSSGSGSNNNINKYPYHPTMTNMSMRQQQQQQQQHQQQANTNRYPYPPPPGAAAAAAARQPSSSSSIVTASGLEVREREGAGNTLLDMSHLLAYLAPRVNPKVPQAVARAALVEVEALWEDLLVELHPKPEMRDEFLIAYFYQPILGCGKEAAHNAENWRHARAAWLSSVGIGSISFAKPGSRTNSGEAAGPGSGPGSSSAAYPSRPPSHAHAHAQARAAPHPFTAAVDWSEEDRLINQLARRKPKKGSASLGGAETYAPPAPQLPAPPKLEAFGGAATTVAPAALAAATPAVALAAAVPATPVAAANEYYEYSSSNRRDPIPVVSESESGMGWGGLPKNTSPPPAAYQPQPQPQVVPTTTATAGHIDLASVLTTLLAGMSPELMATVTSASEAAPPSPFLSTTPPQAQPQAQPAVVQDPPPLLPDLTMDLFRQIYPTPPETASLAPSPAQPAVVQDTLLSDLTLELFRQLYPFAIPQKQANRGVTAAEALANFPAPS